MPASKVKKSRQYGPRASAKVENAMHELKEGTLRSGRSGQRVTRREQAVAIGLAEARREGDKVPRKAANKRGTKTAKKAKSTVA
jgi:hypothetical protein